MKKNTLKLQKLVEKFICGECDVIYDPSGFFYYPDEVIAITLNDSMADNVVWKKFLKQTYNFDLTHENLFSISVLHELGHHFTLDSLSDEEQEQDVVSDAILEALKTSGKNEVSFSSEDLQMIYFNSNREKVATDWAVEMYRANETVMRHWNQRFNCMIRHYKKKR